MPAKAAKPKPKADDVGPLLCRRVRELRKKRGWTLEEMSAACGVSQRTLTRLFERNTGTTPLRYQQTLRLERAEHLIGQGATVDAAAHATGFADARMLRRLRARGPDGARGSAGQLHVRG